MRYRTLFERARMAANLLTGHFRHARHRAIVLHFHGDDSRSGFTGVECRCGFRVRVRNELVDWTPAAKRPPRRRALPRGHR